MSPLDFIGWWDFVVLVAGAVIRFMSVLVHKINEYGHRFDFDKYFDFRHVLRWFIHFFVAVTGLFVMPEFLSSYMPNVGAWTLLGSAVVGFAGYDLVKFVEKLVIKYTSK